MGEKKNSLYSAVKYRDPGRCGGDMSPPYPCTQNNADLSPGKREIAPVRHARSGGEASSFVVSIFRS